MAEQDNTRRTAEEQKKIYERQRETENSTTTAGPRLRRIDRLRYRAYGANGNLDFGVGEGY